MSGRSRRKKLVRSKRLSKTDSEVEATEQQQHQPLQTQQQQQKAEVSNDDEAEQEQQDHAVQPPPLETVETVDLPTDNEDRDDKQNQNKPIDHWIEENQVEDEENPNKLVIAAAASKWRSEADMGDSSNPKWRRVAVRAVQLQDSPKINGGLKNNIAAASASDTTGLSSTGNLSLPPPQSPSSVLPNTSPPQTGITPPPGPWGEKLLENAAVHVDMGKVVGVLRTTTHRESVEDEEENSEEDESTFEETGAQQPPDDSLVLEDVELEEASKCASCAAVKSAHKGALEDDDDGDEDDDDDDDKDESMCGDPLMYATFVAPVHQYSTETEPSRQASFNYPSRQPSFKQNSTEADGSQPDILQVQQPHNLHQLHLGVPSNLQRTSLTPDRCTPSAPVYVSSSQDEIQDIYTEVPPEWPLPPVPPHHLHHHLSSSEMQKHSDQDCVEISQEELERQVQMERLSFISGSSANEEDEEDLDDEDDEDPMAAFLPPPPLPPKPAVLLNQQPRNSGGGGGGILNNPLAVATSEVKRELTPMVYNKHHFWMPEASDLEQIGTVRRKAKRDRNRTEAVVSKEASSISASAMVEKSSSRGSSSASTLSKSRSKSRSPGRSIESNRSSASRPLPCSHHASSSRGNSPDNISESSASFHENELIQQHQPQAGPTASCAAASTASSAQIQAHFRPQQGHTTQGSSSSSSSMVPAPPIPQSAAHPHSAFIYANRDSVRESWISSGSSDHPPPQVYYRRQQVQNNPHPSQLKAGGQPVSSGGTSDASNKSISSGGASHFHRQKQPSSKAEISMVGGSHYAKAPVKVSSMTLPRAANTKQSSSSSCLRHSQQKLQQHQQQHSRSISRESGSSSSRTVSRSGSRSAGLLPQSRSGSSSALASRPRSGTPQEFHHSSSGSRQASPPTYLEFPTWMHQPSVGCDDLTDLECMATIPSRDSSAALVKAEAILANLEQRFKKDQIYTNIGTVLLSINPHKKLPYYTPDVIDIYRCHCLYELPPHIYAVTDRAWRSMKDMNTDQCLIFTGESGSGKTEAMKLSLQYLAAITGHPREFHLTKFQILQSNIVLESFGNAKTRANDNSSRFGKFMEVSFDFKGDPTGAHITNYLLEKSRVTRRYPRGERNFHIFYQLLAGADIQLLKELRLQRNIENYALLRRCFPGSNANGSSGGSSTKSSSTTSPLSSTKTGHKATDSSESNFIDRTEFLITKKAMEDLGFSDDEIHDIFRIISAVLKLGNLCFVPTTNMDGTEGCAISNDYEVHDACHCLRTSYEKLIQVLLVRTIQWPSKTSTASASATEAGAAVSPSTELYDVCEILKGEFPSMQAGLTTRSLETAKSDYLVTDLSVGEASVARDALCRTLYSRLLTWIVSRINEAVKMKTPRKCRTLGLLDLYGFEAGGESGAANGFEQLVFNFAAEKVQNIITEWTLVMEQQEYAVEGVEWTTMDHIKDNKAIVTLLERGSFGLFSILEEVCMSSQNMVLQHQPPPQSSSNNEAEDESGTSTPSLMTVSPDDIFLERLADRFGSHPYVEVRSHGAYHSVSSDNNTTTTTTTAGSEATPAETKEANTTAIESKLPHHCFKIKHFGGPVTYDSRDFVSRNRDALDRELSQAMYECDHPILKVLFPEGNPRRSSRRRPATAATQFKISLGALLNNLGAKMPHYVRCLRPNDSKQSKVFEAALVEHQLTYQGLVEMSELRRHGYVFRIEYEAFLARYKMLSVHTWPHWNAGGSVDGVTCLLRDLPISANEYAFGRTKIFIRTSKTVEILEEMRRERIDELAVLIQKTFRGYLCKLKWMRLRDSQIKISNCWKKWKDKSHVTELKQRRQEEWATLVVQKYFRLWQKRRFLHRLAHNLPSESPLSKEWPSAPRHLRETNVLLRRLYHKWRCHRFRLRFDQIARNRMREKVTASIIFKSRKASYPKSIGHPFLGDYVRLRQNPQWKKICIETNDQYVVFADIINKITRTGGKFVPILFVISTSSMLIMDQRTMEIKYRIPAAEIFKLSLSPYHDDIAVFHVRASSPTRELRSQPNVVPGCLSSEGIKRKGDFVLQTGHVIEIVTKLFLVVQNATGKPPHVNIATEFEANFGAGSVTFNFKKSNHPPTSSTAASSVTPLTASSADHHGSTHAKLVKRGNKMDIFL